MLLGDPGAGKTTAFMDEVEALGEETCHPVSARDFLAIEDPTAPPGRTLFIDGLDEVRAGQRDARTAFEALRRRLAKLGRPRFRLSCREADWPGENDRRHLARVSPGGQVTVLRLDPLTGADIGGVLAYRDDIPDPGHFVAMARDQGVDGLLANPQTPGMLADVVAGGGEWPGSRLETFGQSSRRIVREHNEEHDIASLGSGGAPGVDRTLDAAGRLCAVHLLTGHGRFLEASRRGRPRLAGSRSVRLRATGPSSARPSHKAVQGRTRRSSGPGPPACCGIPRCPSPGRLVEERKRPARRVVALMAGHDGTVVTEMWGLSAWFAARCRSARARLIDRDPIGVVQYGDVSPPGGVARRDSYFFPTPPPAPAWHRGRPARPTSAPRHAHPPRLASHA